MDQRGGAGTGVRREVRNVGGNGPLKHAAVPGCAFQYLPAIAKNFQLLSKAAELFSYIYTVLNLKQLCYKNHSGGYAKSPSFGIQW